jgi:anti-sigma factor RsiW
MATMLDCKKIQPLLSEYVDGTLTDQTAWDVKMHVTTCAVCSRVAEELNATANLLRSVPKLEPSANFEAMLAQRLADQVLTPRRQTFVQRIVSGIAAWQEGQSRPILRPAFATGVVFAALIPVALMINRSETGVQQAASPTPAPQRVLKASAGDSVPMEQLWRDHLSYSSTEPLGDGAGLLTASNTGNGTSDL